MVASGSDSASEGDQRTEKKRKYSQAATQETSRRTADDGDGTSSSLVQEKASPAKKVRTEPRHSEFLEEYIALGSAEAGTTDSRRCYRCDQPGHLASQCTNPPKYVDFALVYIKQSAIPINLLIAVTEATAFGTRPRDDVRMSEDDARRMRRDERRKNVPWARKRYDENPVIALHQEILDLVSYLQPSREEFAMRLDLIDRLEWIIHSVWPQATVKVFGSFSTKLYTASSDIDLVVFGDWKRPPLNTLANALRKAELPEKIDVIAKAKVPIIKLTDSKTQIDIDISFNMPNGPSAAALVAEFIDEYPCLFPLALVLKQFLSQRRLNEPFNGGVGSYSLIAMIVSFLQASMIHMPQLHPRIKDQARSTSLNLGVLLVEFMELYGRHFNYSNTAISLLNGGSYFCKEGHFEFPRDPDKRRPGNFDKLTVQDPQDPTNDAGRSTFNIRTVRAAFSHAYAVLASGLVEPRNLVGATALSSIIRIDDSIVRWRESVQAEWAGVAETMKDRIEPLQWFSRWESNTVYDGPAVEAEPADQDQGSRSRHTRFVAPMSLGPAPRVNNKKSKKKKKEKKSKKSKDSQSLHHEDQPIEGLNRSFQHDRARSHTVVPPPGAHIDRTQSPAFDRNPYLTDSFQQPMRQQPNQYISNPTVNHFDQLPAQRHPPGPAHNLSTAPPHYVTAPASRMPYAPINRTPPRNPYLPPAQHEPAEYRMSPSTGSQGSMWQHQNVGHGSKSHKRRDGVRDKPHSHKRRKNA